MPEYSHLTDDEVLHIAEESDELTAEARQDLELELHRRKLSPADVCTYHAETHRLSEAPDPNLFTAHVSMPYGIGKKFFGKRNCSQDANFDEFDTTLWFVIFWLPLIPISGCRIKREVRRDWKNLFARRIWTVRKLPRNWDLIFITWMKAAVVLLGLILFGRFLPFLVSKLPEL